MSSASCSSFNSHVITKLENLIWARIVLKRHNMNLEHVLLVSNEIGKLRKQIPFEVQKQLNCQDTRIRTYFKRAFVRWIFNAIRKSKNPFTEVIRASDFVSESDVTYFFEKNANLRVKSSLIKSSSVELDWSWLDAYFQRVHQLSMPRAERKLEVFRQEAVVFKYASRMHSISLKQYENAKRLYTGDPNELDARVMMLLSRYDACGTTKNHCSVPPQMVKYINAKTELFGSPFNTCTSQYCSPFYDLEKDFGSLGSFFDLSSLFDLGEVEPRQVVYGKVREGASRLMFKGQPTTPSELQTGGGACPHMQTGAYLMNPPYDEEFMQEAMLRVISSLKSKREITVIVVIPMWDAKSQEVHKGRVFARNDFQALETAEKSGFVRSQAVLSHASHKFYDYYKDQMVAVADAHLLVMSNTRYNLTANQIADEWAHITSVN